MKPTQTLSIHRNGWRAMHDIHTVYTMQSVLYVYMALCIHVQYCIYYTIQSSDYCIQSDVQERHVCNTGWLFHIVLLELSSPPSICMHMYSHQEHQVAGLTIFTCITATEEAGWSRSTVVQLSMHVHMIICRLYRGVVSMWATMHAESEHAESEALDSTCPLVLWQCHQGSYSTNQDNLPLQHVASKMASLYDPS